MSGYKQITSDLMETLENLFSLIYMTTETNSFSCELYITQVKSGAQKRDKAMERYLQAVENVNLRKIFDLQISHCYMFTSWLDSCSLSELAQDFCAFSSAVLLHCFCVYPFTHM